MCPFQAQGGIQKKHFIHWYRWHFFFLWSAWLELWIGYSSKESDYVPMQDCLSCMNVLEDLNRAWLIRCRHLTLKIHRHACLSFQQSLRSHSSRCGLFSSPFKSLVQTASVGSQLTGVNVPVKPDISHNVPHGPPSSLRDIFSPPSSASESRD
jgi:hypothetical protein